MKKKIIKIVVLSIVFVAALILSGRYTNRGTTDMTADMGQPTLPTISFKVDDKIVNLTAGHIKEMGLTAVRDAITPVDEQTINLVIQSYGQKVSSLDYEIYSIDGEKKLFEKSLKEVQEEMSLPVENILEEDQEYLLKLDLNIEEKSVSYYVRLIDAKGLYLNDCLDYAKFLHESMITNTNENEIKRVMEANANGDNTTLQHVTIHSDLEHSMWGKLQPQVLGEIQYSIQETKEAYTSILLRYRVQCVGDNNEAELHEVREYFKIAYSDGETYLLDYDRKMSEVFDGTKVVLMSKGINLGLTTSDAQYKSNEAGTIVSFVQNRELWSYNKEEDEFALVFSFADSEKEDVRNYLDNHSVRILSMEENGNVTFAVNGYMNRGVHEGESGVTIYYYTCAQNVIEEKAFIPSTQSLSSIEKELGEVAYYNSELDILYVLAGGNLYQMNLELDETTVLLEDLTSMPYVSSSDGHLLVYQNPEMQNETIVLNFKEDSKRVVNAEAEEIIIPLGFIKGDYVYGVARPADAGVTASGENVLAMYKLEIRDAKDQVVKTYQVDGSYILDIEIDADMITLKRAVSKNGVYTAISEDYITNNEEKANTITLKSYWTDLKETQFRLVFDEGIAKKKAVVMKPRHILFEKDTTLVTEETAAKDYYAVFGLGRLQGVYEGAGEALQVAKKISGVVISPRQGYVWEDGNRVAWYRNFEMPAFRNQSDESTLAASVRAVLAYEDAQVDVKTEMAEKSILEIMNEYCGGEAVQFKDCSVADMRYLIDKGRPVIVMTGSSEAIVLIGYDAVSVTYIEPSSGAIRMKKFADVDDMAKNGGNTFFGYVK